MGNSESTQRSVKVLRELKSAILSLNLKPGQALRENELCEWFGVSRTPVRDALTALSEQGYVVAVPYCGTYVSKLNYSEIKQLIYMRTAVEGAVICDFCRTATPRMLEEIRYLIRLQEAVILEQEFTPEQFYHLDTKLHEIWFRTQDKLRIWEVLQGAQIHYTRYRMLDFVTETDFTRIIQEHRALFEDIMARDEKALLCHLKEHLSYSITRMQKPIEEKYKDYFEDYEVIAPLMPRDSLGCMNSCGSVEQASMECGFAPKEQRRRRK